MSAAAQGQKKSGIRTFQPGEVLFKENDPATSLYIIQKGQIRLYRPKGRGFVDLAIVRSGEVIGEMAYFDEKSRRRSCSAAAIVTTDVIEISFVAFAKTMEGLNPWFKTIINTLADRLRKTNERVKELESNSVGFGAGGKVADYVFFHNSDVIRALATIYLVYKAHGEVLENGSTQIHMNKLKFYLFDVYNVPEIKFEEFHDFADIAKSGISMFYDSAGVRSDLRSGGMFRISGSQNGESIEVKEGKKLSVDLASIEDTPCYNFYKQEDDGAWNYLHTDTGNRLDSLKQNQLPINPENQDLSNAISIDVDYTDIPELNMYRSLIWRYVGEKIPRAFTSMNWSTAEIKPVEGENMMYKLTVKSKDKNYTMKIQPILTGKNLELALSKYQHDIDKMQGDPNSIYYKTKIIRSVNVDGFGTYNWDIKNKRDDNQVAFPMLATVNGNKESDIRITLISATENIVVNYDKESLKNFSFDPKSKNMLVAFYNGGKIAVQHKRKFKKLEGLNGKKEYISVDLTARPEEDLSSEDLKELISELIRS